MNFIKPTLHYEHISNEIGNVQNELYNDYNIYNNFVNHNYSDFYQYERQNKLYNNTYFSPKQYKNKSPKYKYSYCNNHKNDVKTNGNIEYEKKIKMIYLENKKNGLCFCCKKPFYSPNGRSKNRKKTFWGYNVADHFHCCNFNFS